MLQDYNNLLILGNGFDLDLGLQTSYKSYMNNAWPFGEDSIGLAKFLVDTIKKDQWIDFENAFVRFTSGNRYPDEYKMNIVEVKKQYELIKDTLRTYLQKEETRSINVNSVAARTIRKIAENQTFNRVFTFNFTSFEKTLEKLSVRFVFDCEYIHGDLGIKDIILGAGENVNLSEDYDFFYKSYNPFYRSHNLPYALRKAKDIIIFGHSLGFSDIHYFEKFFKDQSCPGMEPENSKSITIFTKDNKSRIEILRILRNLLGDNYKYLWTNNLFRIIHTDGSSEDNINEFFQYLELNKRIPIPMPIGIR